MEAFWALHCDADVDRAICANYLVVSKSRQADAARLATLLRVRDEAVQREKALFCLENQQGHADLTHHSSVGLHLLLLQNPPAQDAAALQTALAARRAACDAAAAATAVLLVSEQGTRSVVDAPQVLLEIQTQLAVAKEKERLLVQHDAALRNDPALHKLMNARAETDRATEAHLAHLARTAVATQKQLATLKHHTFEFFMMQQSLGLFLPLTQEYKTSRLARDLMSPTTFVRTADMLQHGAGRLERKLVLTLLRRLSSSSSSSRQQLVLNTHGYGFRNVTGNMCFFNAAIRLLVSHPLLRTRVASRDVVQCMTSRLRTTWMLVVDLVHEDVLAQEQQQQQQQQQEQRRRQNWEQRIRDPQLAAELASCDFSLQRMDDGAKLVAEMLDDVCGGPSVTAMIMRLHAESSKRRLRMWNTIEQTSSLFYEFIPKTSDAATTTLQTQKQLGDGASATDDDDMLCMRTTFEPTCLGSPLECYTLFKQDIAKSCTSHTTPPSQKQQQQILPQPQLRFCTTQRIQGDGTKNMQYQPLEDMLECKTATAAADTSVRYTLCAVMCHVGDRRTSGHYVTYVRQSHDPDSTWFLYDDEKVEVGTWCAFERRAGISLVYQPDAEQVRAVRANNAAVLDHNQNTPMVEHHQWVRCTMLRDMLDTHPEHYTEGIQEAIRLLQAVDGHSARAHALIEDRYAQTMLRFVELGYRPRRVVQHPMYDIGSCWVLAMYARCNNTL